MDERDYNYELGATVKGFVSRYDHDLQILIFENESGTIYENDY